MVGGEPQLTRNLDQSIAEQQHHEQEAPGVRHRHRQTEDVPQLNALPRSDEEHEQPQQDAGADVEAQVEADGLLHARARREAPGVEVCNGMSRRGVLLDARRRQRTALLKRNREPR